MNSRTIARPTVLAIAGFDPSGGAGIIVDLRTIESLGCAPVAAITSITLQNSQAYFGAIHIEAESVRAQIEAVAGEQNISAVKIGMLPTAEVVHEIARVVTEMKLPTPVIDPVIESTSGGRLMSDDAFECLVTELLPLARVVTPNVPEAEKLSGVNINSEEDIRQAAARIRELGARAVLVKGGHLKPGSGAGSEGAGTGVREAIDLLADGANVTVFRGEWVDMPNVRGTGCMLSSAIAAGLAQGFELSEAVQTAKSFVVTQIQESEFRTLT